MRNVFALSVMLLFFASSDTIAQINFFKGSWAEAKAKATREGKLIFVDCYASWCQPCQKMAGEVFTNARVGAFFNRNFVCLKENMEMPLRADFRSWVKAYPTLLIFDEQGHFLKKQQGAIFNPDNFIRFGAGAL